MSRASLTINLDAIEELIKKFETLESQTVIRNAAQSKGVIALVAQAIADNFRQERDSSGTAWQPLRAQTIRQSVAKKIRDQFNGVTTGKLNGKHVKITNRKKRWSNGQILAHEAQSRQSGSDKIPNRQILRRTSLLYNSVTTPGANGNIHRTEGTNLIWGTNLIYAAVHNYGGTIKNPGTSNGFGKKIKISAHEIKIPQREFLYISEQWRARIQNFALREIERVMKAFLEVNK